MERLYSQYEFHVGHGSSRKLAEAVKETVRFGDSKVKWYSVPNEDGAIEPSDVVTYVMRTAYVQSPHKKEGDLVFKIGETQDIGTITLSIYDDSFLICEDRREEDYGSFYERLSEKYLGVEVDSSDERLGLSFLSFESKTDFEDALSFVLQDFLENGFSFQDYRLGINKFGSGIELDLMTPERKIKLYVNQEQQIGAEAKYSVCIEQL